jgi:phage-related minor tail protein
LDAVHKYKKRQEELARLEKEREQKAKEEQEELEKKAKEEAAETQKKQQLEAHQAAEERMKAQKAQEGQRIEKEQKAQAAKEQQEEAAKAKAAATADSGLHTVVCLLYEDLTKKLIILQTGKIVTPKAWEVASAHLATIQVRFPSLLLPLRSHRHISRSALKRKSSQK